MSASTGGVGHRTRTVRRRRARSTQAVLVGVDGGQSSTQTVVCDASGTALASVTSAPVGASQTRESILTTLGQGFTDAMEKAGVHGAPAYVHLGLSGVGWFDELRSAYPGAALTCGGDAEVAHRSAFPLERAGVVVVAGTGTVGYGRDALGRIATRGGKGYLVDDAGGAFDIGSAALRAIYRADDGRGPDTALVSLVLRFTGCADLSAYLHDVVYRDPSPVARIADLARLAGVAADQGDAVATSILEQAGEELAWLAASVLQGLDHESSPLAVTPIGGVFRTGGPLRRAFSSRLSTVQPVPVVRDSPHPPVLGAIMFAASECREAAGGAEILSNFVESRGIVPTKSDTTAQGAECDHR